MHLFKLNKVGWTDDAIVQCVKFNKFWWTDEMMLMIVELEALELQHVVHSSLEN